MCDGLPACDGGAVRIWLDLDDGHPPRGRLAGPGTAAVPFVGWLALLALLEEAVEQPSPDRRRDEAGPGRHAELAEDA